MINVVAALHPAVIALICVAGVAVLAGGVIYPLVFLFNKGKSVYFDTLVRDESEKWGYSCSAPDNAEQMAMWDEGCKWAEENLSVMKEVDITSFDGLHLHGEYYDFGADSCVIILPGRCECLRYSCFFGKPYSDMGMNVLVVDSRCHGQSDGVYTTIGRDEGRDALDWAEFLNKEMGIAKVWFHGICVGSAGAFVCATSEDCPDCVKGIIAEGPYISFRETYKQHLIAGRHPVFPILDIIMGRIKKHTGVNYKDVAPIRLVKELDCHILYIFGRQDIFSLPARSRELFSATKSPTKEIVWFSEGCHSHLRINNTKEYDDAIKEYIKKYS